VLFYGSDCLQKNRRREWRLRGISPQNPYPIVSDRIDERSFETPVHRPCLPLMLDDLLGPLPPYYRRTGAGHAHLRIGNLAGGTGPLSYPFSDGEKGTYREGFHGRLPLPPSHRRGDR
jgi:hypothetical protein